jgi:hypothetical protein
MRYDRLIHLKGSSAALDSTEQGGHGARDHNASHFDSRPNENLLDVMAKIGHGDKRRLPNCLLCFSARGRQSSRRVNHCIRKKQIVESVEVSGIPAASQR